MDYEHDKSRMIAEGDRLSNLPDDLIHKIISFISIKQAIETSGLSSRWRYIWTSMPYLNFSTKDFQTLPKFLEFVTRLLCSRNNESDVFSVNLTFNRKVSQEFLTSILKYSYSHNVQQLNIIGFRDLVYSILSQPLKHDPFTGHFEKHTISPFGFQPLEHDTLTARFEEHPIMAIPTWAMPTLTTLNFHGLSFNDKNFADFFSNCENLKNLTIQSCIMSNSFIICHPGLYCLTLERGDQCVNVFTPQLKNLTIKYWRGIHLVSAPNLSCLCYKDSNSSFGDNDAAPLQLPTNLIHLEKVDMCIDGFYQNKAYTCEIVCLFQQLHWVKFLTLSLELVKSLSSCEEVISHQTSPFVNLKSLKIYPVCVVWNEETLEKVTLCTEVKNYLLDGSPNATFTMVSREDIIAVMNVSSARDQMGKLRVLLNQWKENNNNNNNKTNTGCMEQDKAPMEMNMHFGERMTHIKSHWEGMNHQLEEGHKKTVTIISMLQKIEQLLIKLPTSHLVKLQAKFSALCADADTIMDNVMDDLKIQCDKKPRFECLLFDELATGSQTS